MSGTVTGRPAGRMRLCSLRAGREVFGIDSAEVCEVLGKTRVQTVPRAPEFVAGVIPYRGEVLLALSLPVLLGQKEQSATPCALVMKDSETGESFALLVGAVADVIEVNEEMWEPNPATLDERRKALFSGMYRGEDATIVWLEPKRLQPSQLAHRMPPQNGARA